MEKLEFKKSDPPVKIIEYIRDLSFDPSVYETLEKYLEWLQADLWKFHSIGIDIKGKAIEEKCKSAVNQLSEKGFITLKD